MLESERQEYFVRLYMKLKSLFILLILLIPNLSFAAWPKDLLRDVEKSIQATPGIGTYSIKAWCKRDVITLDGEVGSAEAADRVVAAVRNTPGVRKVRNKLTINSALDSNPLARPKFLDDRTVATNLMRTLESQMDLPSDFIIYVYGGRATFRGTARSHTEIDRILSNALMVEGVTGVANEMTIRGRDYK
jgi:osmotically-inducible protein OsmY